MKSRIRKLANGQLGRNGQILTPIKTCILFRVKQITSPGWMHETSTQGWCTGKTRGMGWGGRWKGGSGWETHVNT